MSNKEETIEISIIITFLGQGTDLMGAVHCICSKLSRRSGGIPKKLIKMLEEIAVSGDNKIVCALIDSFSSKINILYIYHPFCFLLVTYFNLVIWCMDDVISLSTSLSRSNFD